MVAPIFAALPIGLEHAQGMPVLRSQRSPSALYRVAPCLTGGLATVAFGLGARRCGRSLSPNWVLTYSG